jgi:hypothetical protein
MKQQDEIKNPFRVPENYFDEVNRKILSATSGSIEKPGVSPFSSFRPLLAAAAALAALIVIGFLAVKLLSPSPGYQEVSEILNPETEYYFNDIDLQSLEESAALTGILEESPEFTSNEIIDYLLYENIQITEIYDQL